MPHRPGYESYNMVVLYIGIMKVRGFQRVIYHPLKRISLLKPTKILLFDCLSVYWLGIADHNNVFID